MNFCLPFLVGDPLTLLVALPGADFSFLGLVSFFSGVNPNFSPSDLKFKNKFCQFSDKFLGDVVKHVAEIELFRF